ncbi:AraC family transcriptional regulator [Roseibium polysiphoniae]|uniref:AraC family transcriptional regulator n=2 Tax=Roseibium polysiphoniae TaxID=2571221 RepID=A0A944CD44_9HYPH|nr:AraC family transcriptional regulator [Roseibium polysiphoniae]
MSEKDLGRLRAGPLAAVEARAMRNGLCWESIASDIGFDPYLYRRHDGFISARKLVDLLEHVADASRRDAEIFDEASTLQIGTLSILDYVTLCAPSIEVGLRNWARFQITCNTAVSVSFKVEDNWGCMEYGPMAQLGKHNQLSYAMATAASSRFMTLSEGIPDAIRIEIDAPAPSGQAAFLTKHLSKIQFDCPRTRIFIPAAVLDEQPPRSESNLYRVVEKAALEDVTAQIGVESPLGEIVETINTQLKNGHISISTVSSALDISERKLQRVISAEGTTFRQLIEETRKSLAQHYLHDTQLSMKEICYLLGFSETSAFSRAAKAWFGKPPRVYREQVNKS